MKICFKRINIIKVFVYLWLICNAEFLYVEPIGNALNRISTYHNKILVTLICIFIFILSMTGITPHGKKYSLIEMELMLLLLFVCCIFLIQLFSNEVSVVDGLSKSYYFFVLLGYIGLAGSCKKYPQLFGWIVNISIKIGTLYAFVNIIFYLVFFYFGIILSYIPMLQQINNGMRIPRSSDFIQYTLVIYMIEIAEGNKRKGNYLGALICSIELIFVAQVRMALVVCGLVLVMIICSKGKYRFVLMFMGLAFCVYFVVNFFLQQDSVVISLFLGTGKRYDSVFYRIIEIKYYMKYIFAGGMFGFGFNGDTELLKYSITDIGILGFFYQFGLMGIVWFISFVYVLFARLHNTKEIGVKAMVVYLIGDCISLSPLNAQRIVFLPFALLFIDMSSKLKIEAKDEYCICHFKL